LKRQRSSAHLHAYYMYHGERLLKLETIDNLGWLLSFTI
jgi:hypothetical protein